MAVFSFSSGFFIGAAVNLRLHPIHGELHSDGLVSRCEL